MNNLGNGCIPVATGVLAMIAKIYGGTKLTIMNYMKTTV